MIVNQIADGSQWHIVKIPVPSMTATLIGDSNQEITMFDAMFMTTFDIAYPFEIDGRSFNSWGDFLDATIEHYISTDNAQFPYTHYTSNIMVTRGVGCFRAIKGLIGGTNMDYSNTTTIPAFNMIIAAKFK